MESRPNRSWLRLLVPRRQSLLDGGADLICALVWRRLRRQSSAMEASTFHVAWSLWLGSGDFISVLAFQQTLALPFSRLNSRLKIFESILDQVKNANDQKANKNKPEDTSGEFKSSTDHRRASGRAACSRAVTVASILARFGSSAFSLCRRALSDAVLIEPKSCSGARRSRRACALVLVRGNARWPPAGCARPRQPVCHPETNRPNITAVLGGSNEDCDQRRNRHGVPHR